MATFNYRTKQGERWDSISFKMYGNVTNIDLLVSYNPSVPLDPILPDGTILFIPIIDNTDSSIIANNLPPWKK